MPPEPREIASGASGRQVDWSGPQDRGCRTYGQVASWPVPVRVTSSPTAMAVSSTV
jgi:hypothetical protein